MNVGVGVDAGADTDKSLKFTVELKQYENDTCASECESKHGHGCSSGNSGIADTTTNTTNTTNTDSTGNKGEHDLVAVSTATTTTTATGAASRDMGLSGILLSNTVINGNSLNKCIFLGDSDDE